jgi:hypothetical protein
MTINLAPYQAIETALFVKITVANYRVLSTDTPATQILTFSEYNVPVTFNGDTYQPLGSLLTVTDSASELRVSPGTMTFTIAGIPNTSISQVVNSQFKGSPVEIWRMVFDAITKQPLAIDGNPVGRFFGYIDNYSIEEDWSGQNSASRVLFTATSQTELLNVKISGRRTNPTDQARWFPADRSMDRVPTLANSSWIWGAQVQ